MKIVVFWDVTPCSLAGRYQRFWGTYSLHQGRRRIQTRRVSSILKMEAAVSYKTLAPLHEITRRIASHGTVIFIPHSMKYEKVAIMALSLNTTHVCIASSSLSLWRYYQSVRGCEVLTLCFCRETHLNFSQTCKVFNGRMSIFFETFNWGQLLNRCQKVCSY
jgi:hypothetical protein